MALAWHNACVKFANYSTVNSLMIKYFIRFDWHRVCPGRNHKCLAISLGSFGPKPNTAALIKYLGKIHKQTHNIHLCVAKQSATNKDGQFCYGTLT